MMQMGVSTTNNKGGHPRSWLHAPGIRSLVMFSNFLLIIMALYQLKPASRSLVLDAISADQLPYIWIASAITLFIAILLYERLLDLFGRFQVVLGTAALFIAILVLFWAGLNGSTPVVAVSFYIFVDLFGVVLVEQFWSLANSVYDTRDGKKWYGLVGTGGLIGGAIGSGAAALLIRSTPLQTRDLLLVGAAIVALIWLLTWWLGQQKIFDDAAIKTRTASDKRGWRHLFSSRYLLLIAAVLLMVQLVSPMIEYEFMHVIEATYPEREARTEALSFFFSILSVFAITVNLVLTPILLRKLGVLAGLLTQPVAMFISTAGFVFNPGLWSASIMKISDRGLSYSINRASKELLYIPVDPDVMYQVKGWIDMFGYRLFKVSGALIIIVLTQSAELTGLAIDLSWVIMAGCLVWIWFLAMLYRDYQAISQHRKQVFGSTTSAQ